MPHAPRRTSRRYRGLSLKLEGAADGHAVGAPGTALLASWQRLRGVPGGRWLFSRLVGRQAPYSGSIGAIVRELAPGHAVLTLADRRSVRNHLDSVHAVALTNLGELASGLALLVDLPAGSQGIVTGIEVEFAKKARGLLTATGEASAPGLAELSAGEVERIARAEIEDSEHDKVAGVRVRWRIRRKDDHPAVTLPDDGPPG